MSEIYSCTGLLEHSRNVGEVRCYNTVGESWVLIAKPRASGDSKNCVPWKIDKARCHSVYTDKVTTDSSAGYEKESQPVERCLIREVATRKGLQEREYPCSTKKPARIHLHVLL